MQRDEFIKGTLAGFVETDSRNGLKAHGGMTIYDPPLIAVAAADDPWFEKFKAPEIIGPHFLPPGEWLAGAQSVIAYFLPFSETVRDSNRLPGLPSEEWVSARIDGERFNDLVRTFMIGVLKGMGGDALAPVVDHRFTTLPLVRNPRRIHCRLDADACGAGADLPPSPSLLQCPALGAGQYANEAMTSNWSERHVAFVAGLGTFGLHKGLIGEKGCAGRYGSVVTTVPLTPTLRKYVHPYEYCPYVMEGSCGACIRRCPSGAIRENGKDKEVCNSYIENEVRALYVTRWGCAKCNLNVPCESGIPKPRTP
jgi:epoxyqueuosine reductase